ncbi:MAG: maltose alpha-D-glucosyltransferase [Gammaproteobacteria bacterium]|nr:maltose alpha-D-glucosyltransferase [Gammaproteobacteria bacterium]
MVGQAQAGEYSGKKYVNWLEQQSLLFNSSKLARKISGHSLQWRHPYAMPQSQAAVKAGPVWFSAYPSAMITKPGQNILQFLGDKKLWQVFSKIGIRVLHTGPMKLAGGIVKYKHTPTVDGWFDRISFNLDPRFGVAQQYRAMVATAKEYHGLIAGDIVPGHTGKGADFLLAERNYKSYPGIYDLVQIKKQDWNLLPSVKNIWVSANLTPAEVTTLTQKGYIPGHLQRVLFSVPGSTKPLTGWDATAPIKGVDGVTRRWVYLHYFKQGQPTMNWLDPSFAAQRIEAGDIIKSIDGLGAKILRLDANPFLGIERKPGTVKAWSEGHPLSVTASDNIAGLIRKLGGWSFQELNLTLDAIHDFSINGPDLSYDFITRPAVEHAALTGDARFLRLSMRLERLYGISPNKLIHDMQNHDEITYELVHYADHPRTKFKYGSRTLTGKQLRTLIVSQMHKLAIGPKTPYNRLSGNGLCTTFVGLLASRFGIKNIYHMTAGQKKRVLQGHMLLAMFNAMQPGIFGLSGWDLVGALPLKIIRIKNLVKDGDYRWVNRGAYDLLNYDAKAKQSKDGIPKASTLYGPILQQLKNPKSFVSQIKHMLVIRKKYGIAFSQQIAVPRTQHKGVVIMLHKLPRNLGYEITALNFGDTPVVERIRLHDIKAIHKGYAGHKVVNLWTERADSRVTKNDVLRIGLNRLQGKILLLRLKG